MVNIFVCAIVPIFIMLNSQNVIAYDNFANVNHEAKPYMDISKITDRTSPQWQYLINLNCVCEDENGLLRVNNDTGYILTDDEYIGVAMGEFWGDIGTKYHIYLDAGTILKVVKVEAKNNKDTCYHNFAGAKFNDIIELVIDSNTPYMQEHLNFIRYDGVECASNGLVYNGNFNNSEEFNGNIVKIKKVK